MMVINCNCLDLLRTLPDNSIDSIVTDPPYGLGKEPDALQMLRDWMESGHHDVKGRGFMGKEWDAFVPQPVIWAECLRVLKPGGHLLSFAGTRTQDLMALGLRIAGFEIRDVIAWVYGSGFPKSMDVSKAIDNAAGAEREVIGHKDNKARAPADVYAGQWNTDGRGDPITAPATPAAQQWQGWGTALKPAMEPITVARKPLAGTVADTVTKYGTGAINIDGCRVGMPDGETISTGFAKSKKAGVNNAHDGWQRPWQQDVEYVADKITAATDRANDLGRWPANLIQDGAADDLLGHAARFFYCPKASKADRNYGCDSLPEATAAEMVDRTEGSDGMNSPRAGAGRTSGARNTHPTVKPIELMRYLCRLVTPPGGTVLDPFSGSGTTGVAAVWEGFNFIGAEMEEKSAEIANARIMFALLDPDRYIDGLDNKKGAD